MTDSQLNLLITLSQVSWSLEAPLQYMLHSYSVYGLLAEAVMLWSAHTFWTAVKKRAHTARFCKLSEKFIRFKPAKGRSSTFCQTGGHIISYFGSQEGIQMHVLAPKRTDYCVFWLHEGPLLSILAPRVHCVACFCSQEGCIVRIFASSIALQCLLWRPKAHVSAPKGALWKALWQQKFI